jgi:uncharacterized membrane protein
MLLYQPIIRTPPPWFGWLTMLAELVWMRKIFKIFGLIYALAIVSFHFLNRNTTIMWSCFKISIGVSIVCVIVTVLLVIAIASLLVETKRTTTTTTTVHSVAAKKRRTKRSLLFSDDDDDDDDYHYAYADDEDEEGDIPSLSKIDAVSFNKKYYTLTTSENTLNIDESDSEGYLLS